MRKIILTAGILLLLSACQTKPSVYVGEIKDFNIIRGSFNSADIAVLTLSDGRKVSVPYMDRVKTGQHLYCRNNRFYTLKCYPPK